MDFFFLVNTDHQIESHHFIILFYFFYFSRKIIAFCLGGNCDNNILLKSQDKPHTHAWTHTHAYTHINLIILIVEYTQNYQLCCIYIYEIAF